MSDELMKIGEVAGFFNVSVKAIRVYEKKGIIKPAKVDEQTGYRYYTVDQIQQLNALIELQQLGFSLSEIKKLLDGGMENEQFMEALVHKKMAWQEQIVAAENKIHSIDKITQRMESSKLPTELHKLSEEERAWLLVKMVCVEDLRGQSVLSEALWL